MATSSRTTRSSAPVLRSLSPDERFYSTSHESAWSTFASSTSSFTSLPSSFRRPSSPTRVNLYGSGSPSSRSPSISFSFNRSVSPSRSIAVPSARDQILSTSKKTCSCAPTTHPGSFRCRLHKNINNNSSSNSNYSVSNHLNAQRAAMRNSLVRIGTVEGDLMKRTLAALIRPSSHQQKRRASFQPRPSRLSIMSKADDL